MQKEKEEAELQHKQERKEAELQMTKQILLVHQTGLSIEDIANIMDLTVEGVQQLLDEFIY